MDSHTMLVKPDQIAMFRLLAIRSGLKLEIQTGMRSMGNRVLRAAQQTTGKKTRKACLAEIQKMIDNSQQKA